MTPLIGPPELADAGVTSVWLAPAFDGAGVHLNGVILWTCADAPAAGRITAAALATVSTLARCNQAMANPFST